MKRNLMGVSALILVLGLTACSNEQTVDVLNSQQGWTIKGKGVIDNDELTRSVSVGGMNGTTVFFNWETGEIVTVVNSAGEEVATITPTVNASNKAIASLTGTITNGTYAVGDPLTYYLNGASMDFTNQKGTIGDLATNFNYMQANVTVLGIDGDQHAITMSGATFTRRGSLFRFRFSDADGNRLHPEELTIVSPGEEKLVLTRSADGLTTTYGDLVVKPVAEQGEYPGELWVHLLNANPASTDTYNFMVKAGDKYYYSTETSSKLTKSYSPGSYARVYRTLQELLANTLTLSATEANVTIGATSEVTVTENTSGGALSVLSSDDAIATASIENNTITITGVAEGTATITVTSAAAGGYAPATKTIEVTVAEASVSVPADAINGRFTINANGDQVYFSKGNLQATYDGTSWSWNFAENQWDYIGNAAGNTKVTSSSPYVDMTGLTTATVDLFGWVGASSTWTGVAQYGITPSRATNNTDGYGNDKTENLKSDWGNLVGDGWRTLTKDEWKYILETRTSGGTVGTTSDARYTMGTINTDGTSVNGVILFPDGITISSSEFTSLFTTLGTVNAGSEWTTKCTSIQWIALAAKGCVFLPAAGARNGTAAGTAGSSGFYWSSSPHPITVDQAYHVYFTSGTLYPVYGNDRRYWGCSVRLVCQVE